MIEVIHQDRIVDERSLVGAAQAVEAGSRDMHIIVVHEHRMPAASNDARSLRSQRCVPRHVGDIGHAGRMSVAQRSRERDGIAVDRGDRQLLVLIDSPVVGRRAAADDQPVSDLPAGRRRCAQVDCRRSFVQPGGDIDEARDR